MEKKEKEVEGLRRSLNESVTVETTISQPAEIASIGPIKIEIEKSVTRRPSKQ